MDFNGNYDGISMGLKLVILLIIQDLFMVTQALGGDADRAAPTRPPRIVALQPWRRPAPDVVRNGGFCW